MQTELSCVNPFCQKESSGEGANQLMSLSGSLSYIYSSTLVKIGGKLKEEFPNNETQSFPYLLDLVPTIKEARTQAK